MRAPPQHTQGLDRRFAAIRLNVGRLQHDQLAIRVARRSDQGALAAAHIRQPPERIAGSCQVATGQIDFRRRIPGLLPMLPQGIHFGGAQGVISSPLCVFVIVRTMRQAPVALMIGEPLARNLARLVFADIV